jgi:2-haloacid dehalogenase
MPPRDEMSTEDGSEWLGDEPAVLVFDVNETLIDVNSLNFLFERIFNDQRVMREWLGHLVMYSMTITLSGLYEDYFSLGRGLLRMVGDIRGVEVTSSDLDELEAGMRTMPAHPDVEVGLQQLRDAGFRMVTLTNSPPNPIGNSPLENAGIAGYFERQFSIGTARAYKPAPSVYHMVAQELRISPPSCFMVSAHLWDTVGAQSAGCTAGLITRPGNAPLRLSSLPQPNIMAPDLPGLATQLVDRWRG